MMISWLYCRIDIKIKLTIATELRDTVDCYQKDLDPAKFFEVLLPCCMDILRNGKPSLLSHSGENVSASFRSLKLEQGYHTRQAQAHTWLFAMLSGMDV